MPAVLPFDRDENGDLRNWSQSLIGRLRSRSNRAALAYWMGLLGNEGLPKKRDINPADMTPFLRSIILLDVCSDPMDFRYRLIGSEVRTLLKDDLTGKWMAEVPHNAAPSKIHSALCRVVMTGMPDTTNIPYVGPRSSFVTVEDLVMPLADDQGHTNHLLVTVDQFSLIDGHSFDTVGS